MMLPSFRISATHQGFIFFRRFRSNNMLIMRYFLTPRFSSPCAYMASSAFFRRARCRAIIVHYMLTPSLIGQKFPLRAYHTRMRVILHFHAISCRAMKATAALAYSTLQLELSAAGNMLLINVTAEQRLLISPVVKTLPRTLTPSSRALVVSI